MCDNRVEIKVTNTILHEITNVIFGEVERLMSVKIIDDTIVEAYSLFSKMYLDNIKLHPHEQYRIKIEHKMYDCVADIVSDLIDKDANAVSTDLLNALNFQVKGQKTEPFRDTLNGLKADIEKISEILDKNFAKAENQTPFCTPKMKTFADWAYDYFNKDGIEDRLAEECAELIQVLMKLKREDLSPEKIEKAHDNLAEEICHVLFIIDNIRHKHNVTDDALDAKIKEKYEKYGLEW